MVKLLLHLVTFSTVLSLFCSTTNHSMLGQSWQVVAQLKALETELLLEESTTLADKEVGKKADAVRLRKRFMIKEKVGSGRVCLS